jgi:uncharacterized protein
MWQRRAFLRAAGAGFAASLLPRGAMALEKADLVFASAIETRSGSFGAALVTERGDVVANIPLPERGHDITFSPTTGEGIIFARQPGTFALVFDPSSGTAIRTLASAEGRHFFGHGVFSPDGTLLYATENDFEAARGVIGLFNARDGFRRIGEFDTFGVGPHEVLLMPDGVTLAIANGGIETHPDYGRAELNIDTMDPSLVFIDRRDGRLIGQLRLAADLHQLSIRHMAVDRGNRVWFGCQFRGAMTETPQLVGYATLEGEIRLISLPEPALGGLQNYIGSVAISQDGNTVGVSSPQGDLVLAIDAASGTLIESLALRDGCGLAADETGLVASSSNGAFEALAGSGAGSQQFPFGFDNHLTRLV